MFFASVALVAPAAPIDANVAAASNAPAGSEIVMDEPAGSTSVTRAVTQCVTPAGCLLTVSTVNGSAAFCGAERQRRRAERTAAVMAFRML